jgi:hypothetical protein
MFHSKAFQNVPFKYFKANVFISLFQHTNHAY